MTSPHWPLTGLVLRTPRIDLRWPALADLDALATLAGEGIHDPGVQPFKVPWTDAPPADRARSTLQYHWRLWGTWQPADWQLALVAVASGAVTGTQEVCGRNFAVLREVSTGSWLGRRFQDNLASRGVSRKLGYAEDGSNRLLVRDQPVQAIRFRLDRAAWQAHRTVPVEILGLAECLPCFGLAS
jgi:hypothetical protein